MKKKLLLLTATYPYGPLDHFVETELEELSKYFDLHIVPQDRLPATEPYHQNYLGQLTFERGVLTLNYSDDLRAALIYLMKRPMIALRLAWEGVCELLVLCKFVLRWLILRLVFRQTSSRYGLRQILRRGKNLLATLARIVVIQFRMKHLNISTFDVIYSYWAHDLALACLFEIGNKSRILSRFHGYDLYVERRSSRYFPFRRFFLKKIKLGLMISKAGREYLLENFNVKNPEKFKIAYIGSKKNSPSIIQRSPRSSKVLKVLTCSSFHPVKQLEKIARAIGDCKFRIHWDHIGGSPNEIAAMSSLAKRLFCEGDATFSFHGHVSHGLILDKMIELDPDVFVNGSLSEGLPVSIMEAMSIGVPIIAPTIGGIAEAVVDKKNGFLLSATYDSVELTSVLEKINSMEQTVMREFGIQSYEHWVQLFNANERARMLAAAIDDVCRY